MMWMLVIPVALAGAIAWMWAGRDRNAGTARELLRERLARGEIDVEEFHRRDQALGENDAWRERRRWLAGGLAALALALLVLVPIIAMASGGWDMHDRRRDTSGSMLVRGGMHTTVSIDGFTFEPGNLEVPAGATVTWTNQDSAPHDATARGGDWETERLSDGESDALTFSTPGEYEYFCSIHPYMKARLVVR